MKRKVKKFNAGGLAEQSLTVAPQGGGGGISGGLSGLQQSASDIGAGALQVESGLKTIRGQSSKGGSGGLLGLGNSPTTAAGLYQNLMGGNRANAIPMQDATNIALQRQAQAFKKGGAVKAKVKASSTKKGTYQRGDGIATKGKTRGRMV
jgi:hypothetical protein